MSLLARNETRGRETVSFATPFTSPYVIQRSQVICMPVLSGLGHEAIDSHPHRAHSGLSDQAFNWRSLLREPLLHFLILGGLIFGIDAALHPPSKDDQTIVVTKALRQSFIDNFDEDKERAPSAETLDKMIDSWVASEILYREGK